MEYRGETTCSLANAVAVVGEKWSFFIVREALAGTTRFAEFRDRLGIAPDVLTARLSTLVSAALMTTRSYQEPGRRARSDYHLTEAGRELALVVAALQGWGDRWTPSALPTSVTFLGPRGVPATAVWMDEAGKVLTPGEVTPVRSWDPAHVGG